MTGTARLRFGYTLAFTALAFMAGTTTFFAIAAARDGKTPSVPLSESVDDGRAYHLGNPRDMLAVMRRFGIGISNADLLLIPLGDINRTQGCAYRNRPASGLTYA